MDLRKAARDPWVWGQLVLFVLVVVGAPRLAGRGVLGGQGSLGSRLPGLGLLLLGGAVTIWGLRSIGPNLTPGIEPLAVGKFVNRGAYAHIRHPIYLGIVLLLAGWAWWIGNPWYGLVTGAIVFAYFDRKAAAEERWLLKRFPGYEEYRRQVGKMAPRWR